MGRPSLGTSGYAEGAGSDLRGRDVLTEARRPVPESLTSCYQNTKHDDPLSHAAHVCLGSWIVDDGSRVSPPSSGGRDRREVPAQRAAASSAEGRTGVPRSSAGAARPWGRPCAVTSARGGDIGAGLVRCAKPVGWRGPDTPSLSGTKLRTGRRAQPGFQSPPSRLPAACRARPLPGECAPGSDARSARRRALRPPPPERLPARSGRPWPSSPAAASRDATGRVARKRGAGWARAEERGEVAAVLFPVSAGPLPAPGAGTQAGPSPGGSRGGTMGDSARTDAPCAAGDEGIRATPPPRGERAAGG